MIELIPSGPYAPGSGGGGGDMIVHELFGAWHTGILDESQAPWVDTKIAEALVLLDPHDRLHNVTNTLDHSITGNAFDVLGAVALNTIGLITPSSDPGANSRLLRTNDAGELQIVKLITPLIGSPTHLDLNPDADLLLSPLSMVVRMSDARTLQTDHFQSQLRGWRITYPGEGDFRYLYADQLKAKSFIVDITQALAGSEIITKSVSTLSQDFVMPYPGEAVYMYLDDLPSAEDMAVFEANDFVRVREFSRAGGGLSITDCWGIVTDYEDLADKEQRWTFTRIGTTYGVFQGTDGQLLDNTGTWSNISVDEDVTPGDLMFTLVVLNRVTTITAPAGWTLLVKDETENLTVALYYRWAATEPSDYTWNFGSSGKNQVSTYEFSGVNASEPIGHLEVVKSPTGGTLAEIAFAGVEGISTFGDRIVTFAGLYNPFEDLEVDPPEYFTEIRDNAFDGIFTWASELQLVDAGLSAPFTATILGTGQVVAFAISLVPAYNLSLETGYGTPGTVIEDEAVILDYGVSGNGWIEMTTIDGLYGSNSPYTKVVNWYGHPATGAIVRTLMGNLNGLFSPPGEYGFYAGTGTGNNDSYFKASSAEVKLNNIPIKMHNGLGIQTVQIGANGDDIWVGPNGSDRRLNWDGATLTVKGQIIITDGSGYTALTDRPTSLSGINSTEGTKLGGIEDGATVGAKWSGVGANLSSIPTRFGDAPTVSGLYLTPTHLGFYDAAVPAWKAWIASNGFFYFGGNSGAHLEWNGVKLRGLGTDGVTEQWYANSLDGKFYAGAGAVVIDSGGFKAAYGEMGMDATGLWMLTRDDGSYSTTNAISFRDYATFAVKGIIQYWDGPAGGERISIGLGTMQNTMTAGLIVRENIGGVEVIGKLNVGGLITSTSTISGTNLYASGGVYASGGILETTSGAINVRIGNGGTPRVILDNGTTVWQMDNFTDYFRIFKSGDVKLSIGPAGDFNVNGYLGESWSGLSFGSGWTNFGSGWTTGQVKKFGDMVYIRGLVYRTSGSGTTICTLPVGYRPNNSVMLHCISNDIICRVDIGGGGVVSYVNGGAPGSWIWLDHCFSVLP